jgi:hypothetical protein
MMRFFTQLSTMDKLRINIQLDPRGTQRETPSIAFIDSVFLFHAMAQLFNPEFATQQVGLEFAVTGCEDLLVPPLELVLGGDMADGRVQPDVL